MTPAISVLVGVFLYLALVVVSVLAGRGMLDLFKLQVPYPSRTLLGPVVTQLGWTVVLGITGGLGLTVRSVTPWLWALTALAASVGLRRRASPAWILLCAALPMITMSRFFLHGLCDYIGSVEPDGWAYAAAGQFMWEHARGSSGGGVPLYEFASHLSTSRYISFSLLGFLSPLQRAGDTQAVSALFQAWTLFTFACAVAFFWIGERRPAWQTVTAVTLSVVSGWIVNLLWMNNFDNGLALLYIPLFVGIARDVDVRDRRWFAFCGVAAAALVYTYPEFGVFILACAALLFVGPFVRDRAAWKPCLIGAAIALAVGCALLLPSGRQLILYAWGQYRTTMNGARAGEGLFAGLVEPRFFLRAFWALGGEQQAKGHAILLNAVAVALTLLAAAGWIDLLRQRRRGLALAIALPIAAALYFIVVAHYPYGAYKFIALDWWGLVALVVVGASELRPGSVRAAACTLVAILAATIISQSFATSKRNSKYVGSPNQGLRISEFRKVNEIKPIVGDGPVVIWVDDWLANEWAVYHLRDVKSCVPALRMYMSTMADELRPFLVRTIVGADFVLSDGPAFARIAEQQGWDKKWTGGPYVLWSSAGKNLDLRILTADVASE